MESCGSFKILAGVLAHAINRILPVVPAKHQRDVLKCFKLICGINPSKLTIQASDMETYISINITQDLEVERAGTFLVSASDLSDLLKSTSSDEGLNFLVEKNSVTVTLVDPKNPIPEETGGVAASKFVWGLLDVQDFPPFAQLPEKQVFKISIEGLVFSTALSQVVFATAEKNHPKYAYTALCLVLEKTNLSFIGSDSRRVSLLDIPIEGPDVPIQVLVPPESAKHTARIFEDQTFTLALGHNVLCAYDEDSYLIMPTIEGNFPAVKKYIPKYPYNLALSYKEFLPCLKKAMLAADAHSTLRIELSPNMMHLSTNTRERRREARSQIPVVYSGPALKTAVDGENLLQALKAVKTDLDMHFDIKGGPLLFTRDNYYYMLSPKEI